MHEVDTGRKYIYHDGEWVEDLRPHVRNFVWDPLSLAWVAMTGNGVTGMVTSDPMTQDLLTSLTKQLQIMNMQLAIVTGNEIKKTEVE